MTLSGNVENENELICLAQDGDRNAFGELVSRYYTGVVNVVYRLCGSTGMAEDMAQEAFLRAWVNLSSFHAGTSLRNWLYRIAVNATLDVLRRRSEESMDVEKVEMIAETDPGPEAAMIQKEQTEQLVAAMNDLPEAARSVLVLREYGALSYTEIAAVLDIPIGTVMSRLNYARNSLRSMLVRQELQMEHEYA